MTTEQEGPLGRPERAPVVSRLDVNGLDCECLTWDGGGDTTVLLVHGYLDSAWSWGYFVDALTPIWPEAHVVAFSWRGHGTSARVGAGGFYHFVDYVSDVLALAQALGLTRFDLIGHSMGGAIATLVAASYPEQVRRLVLIEALGPLARPADACVADMRRAIDARLALHDKQLKVHPDRDAERRARMQANGLSEAAADALIERALMPAPGGYVWRSDPRQTLPTPIRGTEAKWQNIQTFNAVGPGGLTERQR
jgi:pimeloyl-ACP methyl ester carboxylesterase